VVGLEEKNNIIRKLVFRLVKKHIAGSTSTSVLNVVRDLNEKGFHATVTLLNDHVDDAIKARYNTNAYIQFIRQLSRLHLNSDVSLRLSQIGYWLDEDLLAKNLESIAEAAKSSDHMVWIENESNLDARMIMPLYRKLKQKYGSIGLEMTTDPIAENRKHDLNGFVSSKDIIKLRYDIKNARKEKSSHSKDKYKLYKEYIDALMNKKVSLTLLEQDTKLTDRIMGSNKDYKRNLILEFPLGYNSKGMGKLQKGKMNLSVYVPYGKDWIPYFINRLAEGRVKNIAVALLDNEKAGVNSNAKRNKAEAG
jgi:proline dehydrogenase